MDVDLFTWGAQIVNFLVLVALLRHFLYGRIVNAIDARQERIATRWEDAEKEKQQAGQRAREYEDKQKEFERKRDELLSEAKAKAEDRKNEMIEQARAEVDELKAQWRKSLEQDKRSFMENLRQATTQEVSRALRQILGDLANADLQSQAVRRFVGQLTDSQERTDRVHDLVGTDETLRVRTSFDLSKEQRNQIRDALKEAAGRKVNLEFVTSDDLICGIELRADGQKIAWSIRDYLSDLDEKISERLEQRRWNDSEDKESESKEQPEEQEQHAD